MGIFVRILWEWQYASTFSKPVSMPHFDQSEDKSRWQHRNTDRQTHGQRYYDHSCPSCNRGEYPWSHLSSTTSFSVTWQFHNEDCYIYVQIPSLKGLYNKSMDHRRQELHKMKHVHRTNKIWKGFCRQYNFFYAFNYLKISISNYGCSWFLFLK